MSDDPELPDYMTPYYWAVTDHDFAKAQAMLDAGLIMDEQPSDEGHTLLHMAVAKNDRKILKFILQAGCGKWLNTFDYVTHTPLMWAAQKSKHEIARLLLAAGADVNAYDEARIGDTAIKIAVGHSDPEMVDLLLRAGADPTIEGWMRVDACLAAKTRLENAPKSEKARQIAELVDAAMDKRKRERGQ